jgi:host factor-I protein
MTKIYQDYLLNLKENSINVSIYLINGIKLTGIVCNYDDKCLVLRDTNNVVNQLIFMHAISTIVPAKLNV